ncbi:MAG: hypothetical protein LBB11_02600, partial [Puniceicoccales bacterium]|nr:hypothetical protein [Puniceicoccales bacterium]
MKTLYLGITFAKAISETEATNLVVHYCSDFLKKIEVPKDESENQESENQEHEKKKQQNQQ